MNLNLHLYKGVKIDSIYSENHELEKVRLTPAALTEDVDITPIKKVLTEAPRIFSCNNAPLQIDIADAYLRFSTDEDKEFAWGHTTKCSPHSFFIFIDSSMWKDASVIHELLHVFQDCENFKTDSAKLFFKESLIEYLAVCLRYNMEQADSVFSQKIEYYNHFSGNGDHSVFNLENNEVYGDGKGSSNIVYQKTPYNIHLLAKKTGQKHFISLLSEFYHQAREKKEYSFEMFEQIIRKEGGVKKDDWLDFLRQL
jgi:hypothetical protein